MRVDLTVYLKTAVPRLQVNAHVNSDRAPFPKLETSISITILAAQIKVWEPKPARGTPALLPRHYNVHTMSLIEKIQLDITAAMKAREEQRLSCLRMVKTALKNREIEKMAPLDDKEALQVLSTLIKQRKDSVEQFTKGGRQEMADKEAAEIKLIESYMPKSASEEEVVAGVKAVIAEMGSPTMKDMGMVMKNAMARFAAASMRVDGKLVSETVKRELAGK